MKLVADNVEMHHVLLEITQDMVGIRLEQDFDAPGQFYLIHPAGVVQRIQFAVHEEGDVVPNYPAHFLRWIQRGIEMLFTRMVRVANQTGEAK